MQIYIILPAPITGGFLTRAEKFIIHTCWKIYKFTFNELSSGQKANTIVAETSGKFLRKYIGTWYKSSFPGFLYLIFSQASNNLSSVYCSTALLHFTLSKMLHIFSNRLLYQNEALFVRDDRVMVTRVLGDSEFSIFQTNNPNLYCDMQFEWNWILRWLGIGNNNFKLKRSSTFTMFVILLSAWNYSPIKYNSSRIAVQRIVVEFWEIAITTFSTKENIAEAMLFIFSNRMLYQEEALFVRGDRVMVTRVLSDSAIIFQTNNRNLYCDMQFEWN